ncbi:MAG TPA: hypothetical protein VMT20_03175 [Terriglobia bacterium]|nr:hypothetical protein [Terriglobia bacterium]
MKSVSRKYTRVVVYVAAISMLALPMAGLAQDGSGGPPSAAPQQNPAPAGTWQHFATPPQSPAAGDTQNRVAASAETGGPNAPAPVVDVPPGQEAPNQGPPYQDQAPPNQAGSNGTDNGQQNDSVPPRLMLRSGTFINVRTNQLLSSDQSHPGDKFTATITDPVVVNGFVVAAPGQTVGGRVVDAEKAGMVKGVSRLALQLTSLTLVDGQTVPIQTQLSGRTGPTSKGRDAAAVATTTGVGAGIGAAVSHPWEAGTGAAIGAGAGLAIGLAGVLLTRGQPTVIEAESRLTFEVSAPVNISTADSPQAFRYMDPNAYQASVNTQAPPPRSASPCSGYGCPPPPPPPPYYYYGPGYPYYWGPSIAIGWGPRYYGGWGWYRGGWYRGGHYGRR